MSMNPSLRLEYGPNSGAILGAFFIATSLKQSNTQKPVRLLQHEMRFTLIRRTLHVR